MAIVLALLDIVIAVLGLWFLIVGIRAFHRYLSLNPALPRVALEDRFLTPEQRAEQANHRAMMDERNPEA